MFLATNKQDLTRENMTINVEQQYQGNKNEKKKIMYGYV